LVGVGGGDAIWWGGWVVSCWGAALGFECLVACCGFPLSSGSCWVASLVVCVGVGGDSLEVGVWVLVGRGWLLVVVLLWVWSVWFCLPGWRSPCGVSSWGCGGLFLIGISLVGCVPCCVWRWVSFRVCEGAKVCHPRCGVLGSVPWVAFVCLYFSSLACPLVHVVVCWVSECGALIWVRGG